MMRRALRATLSTHPMTLRLFGCHKGTVARRPQSLLRMFLHALLVVLVFFFAACSVCVCDFLAIFFREHFFWQVVVGP